MSRAKILFEWRILQVFPRNALKMSEKNQTHVPIIAYQSQFLTILMENHFLKTISDAIFTKFSTQPKISTNTKKQEIVT
jgi:hypothetical protein